MNPIELPECTGHHNSIAHPDPQSPSTLQGHHSLYHGPLGASFLHEHRRKNVKKSLSRSGNK